MKRTAPASAVVSVGFLWELPEGKRRGKLAAMTMMEQAQLQLRLFGFRCVERSTRG
jgi:hypothetical protein